MQNLFGALQPMPIGRRFGREKDGGVTSDLNFIRLVGLIVDASSRPYIGFIQAHFLFPPFLMPRFRMAIEAIVPCT